MGSGDNVPESDSGRDRTAADRVEPQPVIAPRPGVAEALILLENDGVDTASLERPGRRETRRPGADDDDGGLRHGVVSNAVGPGAQDKRARHNGRTEGPSTSASRRETGRPPARSPRLSAR